MERTLLGPLILVAALELLQDGCSKAKETGDGKKMEPAGDAAREPSAPTRESWRGIAARSAPAW